MTSGAHAAEKTVVRTRDNDASQDDGEFESWISGLAGGETTVRRLRERLDATGEIRHEPCAVCEDAATGVTRFGHADHEHERLTA